MLPTRYDTNDPCGFNGGTRYLVLSRFLLYADDKVHAEIQSGIRTNVLM